MKSSEFLFESNSNALSSYKKISIFESIGQGDLYFKKWEKEIHPILCEVALKPDQIQQLFKNIESGGGRSGLGKALDFAKGAKDKISDVWFNKFGGMLQSSAPVQAFDQKWEDIKSKVAAKNPELAAKLAKYGEFAKNNPKLHKFLLAIAGSAAAALGVAVAGGVGAGALAVGTGAGVATGILNIADRLLQGQKASTAIGRGATTGAVAGLTAGLAAKIASGIANSFKAEYLQVRGANKIMNGTFNNNGQWSFVTGKAEDVQMLSKLAKSGDMGSFYNLVDKMRTPEYLKGLDASREIIKQAAQHYQSTVDTIKTLAQVATAASGGVSSAATNQQPKESLSESQIQEIFGITGNKIDASKLEKAWQKAGKPTDSAEIAKLLADNGVAQEIVTDVFAKMKIPAGALAAPAASPAAPATQPAATKPAAPAAQQPAQAAPAKPGVNPELQKRLALRKAGRPAYAGALEEEQTDEGQIYSTGGGAGQSYRKFRPKTEVVVVGEDEVANLNNGNGWRWYKPKTESNILKGIQNEGR